MGCNHEHLRTVGDRLFCKDCEKELPIEFLTKGMAIPKAEQAKNTPAEEKTGKPAPKRTAAKKTAKKAE